MELKNKYYNNLQLVSNMMQTGKEELAKEIMNLTEDSRVENDTHSLEVTKIKDHNIGTLFYLRITEKMDKKCSFSGPVLLKAPKRVRRK